MKKILLLLIVFLTGAASTYIYFNFFDKKAKPIKKPIIAKDSISNVSNTDTLNNTAITNDSLFIKNDSLNDLAFFIAGIKNSNTSYLKDLKKDTSWIKYSHQIEKIWQKVDTLRYRQIEKWTTEQLKPLYNENFNLFYPFSGPDFLSADLFFPNADTVTMIGLEPVGHLPEVNKDWFKDSLSNYVYGIKKALNTILNLSFFKTKDMFTDLRAHELNGATHLVIWFASRRGYEMVKINQVALNYNGELIYKTKGDTSYSKSAIKGMEICCKKGNQTKVIRYFSADISNGGLKKNKRLETYLNTINYTSTLVKSASYLMHAGNFTTIRNIILNNSKTILQDDTGIPYKNINEKNWELTLYGDYEKPINLFSKNYQEDLKLAYDSLETKPLPFGIGYKYRKSESTWMLLNRKEKKSMAKL